MSSSISPTSNLKPVIGKRKAESDDEEPNQVVDKEELARRKTQEKRVRQALAAFLSSKGVDISKHLANLQVILTLRSEPPNPRKKGPSVASIGDSYKVTFLMADGTQCHSQAEVYAACQNSASKLASPVSTAAVSSSKKAKAVATTPAADTSARNPDPSTVAMRKESHEIAMREVAAITQYPHALGPNLSIHQLGNLDPRPAFQTSMQLYPLGYRAEITVADTENNRAFVGITAGRSTATLPQRFLASIKPGGATSAPVFKLQNLATNTVHEALSEEEVFRMHFPGILKAGKGTSTGANGEGDGRCGYFTGTTADGLGPWVSSPPFSFFNYEAEKLIEGLKGALLCNKYKMHCERLPAETAYTDQKGCDAAKRSLIISRFNAMKPAAPETKKVTKPVPAQPKEQAPDAIAAAFRKQQDKEARAREHEVNLQQKEQERQRQKMVKQQDKVAREQQKREEARIKAEEQKMKMQLALHHKYRNAYRPEVKKAVLKNQRAAALHVLDTFDMEESEESISDMISEMSGEAKKMTVKEELGAFVDNANASAADLAGLLKAVSRPCSDVLLDDLPSVLREGIDLGDSTDDIKSCDFVLKSLPSSIIDPMLRLVSSLSLQKDFLNIQEIEINARQMACTLATHASLREAYIEALKNKLKEKPSEEVKKEDKVKSGDEQGQPEPQPGPESKGDVVKVERPSSDEKTEQVEGEGAENVSMDVENDEAEATFEDNLHVPELTATEQDESDEESPAISLRGQAIADLERIVLCLTQAISAPLHSCLFLDDDVTVSTFRNDSPSPHQVRFPLNQMTFKDIARMSLITRIMPQLAFTYDEIRCLLQGGTSSTSGRSNAAASGYRNNKNVIRHIRYRMLARQSAASLCSGDKGRAHNSPLEDRLKWMRDHITNATQTYTKSPLIEKGIAKEGMCGIATMISTVPETDFDDADDMSKLLGCLIAVADSNDYSDAYRRCAKVLHKLCTLSCGKGFLWDQSHREYLQIIRHPMSFSAIATRIYHRSYGDEDEHVANSFYNDMRVTAINAFVYHSESVPQNANSQKALLAIHRYTYHWVFSPRKPDIADCLDTRCFLSGRELTPLTQIKCGRCTGPFSLDALHEASIGKPDEASKAALSNFECLIAPDQELVDKSNEEWICPLCLEEDSSDLRGDIQCTPSSKSNSGGEESLESVFNSLNFWIDEFGPSAHVPWHINPLYSRALIKNSEGNPQLMGVILRALSLLASNEKSILHATVPNRMVEEEAELIGGKLTSAPESEDVQAALGRNLQPWDSKDWVCIMTALSENLKGFGSINFADSAEAFDRLFERKGSLNDLCLKLINLSLQSSPFKETEFMRVVKDIAGEEGVKVAREGLDKINAEKDKFNNTDLRELMTAAGLASSDSGTTFSDSAVVDKFRDKDAEDRLLNRSIDIKAAGDPNAKNKGKIPERLNAAYIAQEKDWARVKCQYCGLSELEVCSPFVIGQSARDHAYHQSRHGDNAVLLAHGTLAAPQSKSADTAEDGTGNVESTSSNIKGSDFVMKDTQVFIRSGLNDFRPPPLQLPYFPLLETPDGQNLQQVIISDAECIPVLVHQSCALLMFKARVERKNHELRRKRKALAQRIINLTGLYTTCLGYDSDGREYWKFPSHISTALFVCSEVAADSVEEEFRNFMLQQGKKASNKSNGKSSSGGEGGKQWCMISDLSDIQGVLKAVRESLSKEKLSAATQRRVTHLAEALTTLVHNLECCKPVALESEPTKSEIGEAKARSESPVVVTDSPKQNIEGLSEPPTDHMEIPNQDKQVDLTATDSSEGPKEVIDIDAEPAAAPAPVQRGRRENSGVMSSWLVKGGSGNASDKISHLHSTKKSNADALNLDQFAYVDPQSMTLPESQPVELRYVDTKGVSILPHYLIDSQSSFEERRPLEHVLDEFEENETQEDVSYEEYFTFNGRGRKFMVLALYNNVQKKVRVPKGAVRLRFEVYRKGHEEPLYSYELDELWSDGYYYFSAPTFRRAGQYRYVFTTEPIPEYVKEGKPPVDTRYLKPVTFNFTVAARRTLYGAKDAISKLEAHKFKNRAGRRIQIDRIRFSSYKYMEALEADCEEGTITECNSVKLALMTVFNALPCGSLIGPLDSGEIANTGVAHASGWSDELEDVWFTSLLKAQTPQELMECALLLEYYVAKPWLEAPLNRLQQALPAFHLAVRCATFSSVSLRIFCLDRALSYSTVIKEAGNTHLTRAKGGLGVTTGRRREAVSYTEDSPSDAEYEEIDEENDDDHMRGRSRRGAAHAASNRIRNQSDKNYQAYEENEGVPGGRRGGSRRNYAESDDENGTSMSRPADSWTCGTCTMENKLRARSCEACGQSRSASAQSSKARKTAGESSDEFEDEEDDGDDTQGVLNFAEMIDKYMPEDEDEVPDASNDTTVRQLSLLRFIYNDQNSAIFWSPVPDDTPQYFDIVKEPRDFGTITENVMGGTYFTDDGESTSAALCDAANTAFHRDVMLVFSNCKLYNKKGPLVKISAALEADFTKQYQAWVLDEERPLNPNVVAE